MLCPVISKIKKKRILGICLVGVLLLEVPKMLISKHKGNSALQIKSQSEKMKKDIIKAEGLCIKAGFT